MSTCILLSVKSIGALDLKYMLNLITESLENELSENKALHSTREKGREEKRGKRHNVIKEKTIKDTCRVHHLSLPQPASDDIKNIS